MSVTPTPTLLGEKRRVREDKNHPTPEIFPPTKAKVEGELLTYLSSFPKIVALTIKVIGLLVAYLSFFPTIFPLLVLELQEDFPTCLPFLEYPPPSPFFTSDRAAGEFCCLSFFPTIFPLLVLELLGNFPTYLPFQQYPPIPYARARAVGAVPYLSSFYKIFPLPVLEL